MVPVPTIAYHMEAAGAYEREVVGLGNLWGY